MRTLTSSAININNTSSSSSATSSYDTPATHHAYSSTAVRSAAASSRSVSASAASQTLNPKRFPTAKSPRSPVTPSPQARSRFPSAPVPVAVVSDSRSPPGYNDHKQQQHVLALTTTTTRSTSASSAASSASKMPPDSRPRPPQLSAAAAKTIGRTPLTPKIAGKGPTLAAPLVRRSTQNREDAFVNSITPRSSGRQSRVESTNTTPNGTPNPERAHDGWDPRASLAVDSGRQSTPLSEGSGDSADSKFFYASDARNIQQPPSRPSSAAPKSSATFFYANGSTAEPKRALSPPMKSSFAPMLANPPEPAQSKFFYASGTPEIAKSGNQSSGPPSAGSTSSKVMSGRPSTSSSATGQGYSMPQRPLSPIKMLQQQNPPPILKNTVAPGLNNRAQLTSTPPLTSSTNGNSKRRISIESTPRSSRGHARTSSVPSIDSGASPRITMSPPQQASEPSSPPGSPIVTQPAMTMASILQAAEDLAEEEEEDSPGIQSPTKSTHSSDPVSELVANARRERKVQDLEITNASLEAINRTLERQLRKQTAEIRRYRRLSRAGHLSVPSVASSRVPSETLADVPISLTDLSEEEESMMSEEEEEPDSLDDSELSSTESTSAPDPLDPNDENVDEKVAARRQRDERRLQLDLSKHRELLVDSQKINQSLKRCLNWTEVLIKEGQKALEYKVRVSDVQFGGHVLPAPDEEEASQLDEQLFESLEADLEPPPQWEKSSQDRDSGIELQAEIV